MILEKNAILTVAFGLATLFVGIAGKSKPIRLSEEKAITVEIKTIIVFIYLWLVAILIRDSYDIFFYRAAYVDRLSHGKELFFDFIQFSLHDIGLSFEGFVLIWNTIVMILLFTGIRKYTDNVSAVAALTILGPFTLYITQMRNSMVAVILLNCFPLLFTGRKQDRVLYAFIVFLCAQIHIIAYAYLVFLLLSRNGERSYQLKYFIVIAIATICALAISVLPPGIITGLISKLPLPGSITGRLIAYIGGEKTSIKSAIFLIIKHVFLYWLTDRACRLQIDEHQNDEGKRREYSILREMNTMMLLFLPISILNASFERIFNCFIIIQYAMVFNVRRVRTGLFTSRNIEVSMQFILLLLIGILTYIGIYTNPDDLVRLLNSIGVSQ